MPELDDTTPAPDGVPVLTLDALEQIAADTGCDYYELLLAWANARRRGA